MLLATYYQVRRLRLAHLPKMTLLALCARADHRTGPWASVTVAELCEDLAAKRSAVLAALKDLRSVGFVSLDTVAGSHDPLWVIDADGIAATAAVTVLPVQQMHRSPVQQMDPSRPADEPERAIAPLIEIEDVQDRTREEQTCPRCATTGGLYDTGGDRWAKCPHDRPALGAYRQRQAENGT